MRIILSTMLIGSLLILSGCANLKNKFWGLIMDGKGGVVQTSADPSTGAITPCAKFGQFTVVNNTIPKDMFKSVPAGIKFKQKALAYQWFFGNPSVYVELEIDTTQMKVEQKEVNLKTRKTTITNPIKKIDKEMKDLKEKFSESPELPETPIAPVIKK